MSLYGWLFDGNGEEDAPPDYALAHQVLEWASQPYHARFMRWLEEEALRPTPLGADKLEESCRADAFKEVRTKIKRTIAAAETAVANQKEI